jgi:ADP-ribose diphosphatase
MTPDATNPPAPWIRESTRTLAKTRIFTLENQHWRCTSDPACSGDFAVLDSPDWVNVFAITPDDKVILVEQFRFGVGILSLEIPGGIVDPDENPETTASRELQEETGYIGDQPVLIGSLSANAAILNNRVHTFVIGNARLETAQNLDEHEQIRVKTAPLADLPELIRTGTIHHSVIVAAYALFQIWNKK